MNGLEPNNADDPKKKIFSKSLYELHLLSAAVYSTTNFMLVLLFI